MSRSKHPDTCMCALTNACAKRFWIWWKRKYDDEHEIAIRIRYIAKLAHSSQYARVWHTDT